MEVDALLEACQDFEKKEKKDTSPVLEQFLCHVAKTGQTMIPWSRLKTYFLFKIEKVMDDFHASTPKPRPPHNPNIEYIPFEEMKTRILGIVDGYSGTPFTIQRLCELLVNPKRNYTEPDKFLRGLEKNVMVVSCVYPTLEKNVAASVKGMNGMFPANSSLYSDSETVNGPGSPEPLGRPKLLLSASVSANGLSDCTTREKPLQTTEELAKHHTSDSSLSQGEGNLSIGLKNKHGNDEDSEVDKHEVKRLKSDKDGGEMESEEKESSSFKWAERLETPEHLKDSCESSSMLVDTLQGVTALEVKKDSTEDRPDQPAQPDSSTDFEQDSTNAETSHKLIQSSSSCSGDLSLECDADN